MPIRQTTPVSVVDEMLDSMIQSRIDIVIKNLCYVGERCVIEARQGGTYQDITGNLRSSIGYAVIHDGNVVEMSYPGAADGQSYLQKMASDAASRNETLLIVTAGMNYAEYVETRRVVLSSAENLAPPLVKRLLTSLGFTIR